MKVILLDDVKGIGKKHQIVDVNDGYAKNFLIKKNLAVQETKASLNKLQQDLNHEKELYEESVYEAELLKKKIESLNLNFKLKSNHQGNTFGKITIKEIIDTVNKYEKLINKYMFNNSKKEWSIGKHLIELKLHKDVIAYLPVKIEEE